MSKITFRLAFTAVALSVLTITAVFAQQTTKPAGDSADKAPASLYTLDTCPVSGQKLGSKGDAVVKTYNNREVRFCCNGCPPKFETAKEKYFKQIDDKLIEQQLPYYPLQTCVVMNDSLSEDGKDIGVNVIYGNRLVRFCCNMCPKDFGKDPQSYLTKLDEAVKEQQRAHYPLETCVVAGGKLGSMGEPFEMVVGNRLVRFCCAGCKPGFEAEPAKYIAMLDEAWKPIHAKRDKDAGAHKGHDHDAGHDHNSHDGHGHDH